jgi:hypothetical protein
MALFIAADNPLPVITWDEATPAFHVQELSEWEQAVRQQFTRRYVYFLGAHTGCSCGFAYGQMPPGTAADESEEAAGRLSVSQLQAYLATAVQQQREVELFACWEGDWELPREAHHDVAPGWFGGETFRLPERVHFLARE